MGKAPGVGVEWVAGCLVIWLVGWWVGCLVDWFVGWLGGWRLGCVGLGLLWSLYTHRSDPHGHPTTNKPKDRKEDLHERTFDMMWDIFVWDMKALCSGKFNKLRHDGTEFHKDEYLSALKDTYVAGGARFAIVQLKQEAALY